MTIRPIAAAAAVVLALSAGTARAEPSTVVLSVENATCALCGPIVRLALQRVPGVETVQVAENYAMSPAVVATVAFDDAVTSIEALTTATAGAGFRSYPSSLSPAAVQPQPAPVAARPWWRFW